MRIKRLILIGGVPGSGKSTIAKEQYPTYDHYEADMFHYNEKGEYEWKPENIKDAHFDCRCRCRRSMEEGNDVVVANTFIKHWERKPYLDMAKEFGYQVVFIKATGEYENIHGVPKETVERMKDNWEEFDADKD